MPANCSADVQAVIARVDETFLGKNETAIQAIKDNFGIGDVTHLDDAAGARKSNSVLFCYPVSWLIPRNSAQQSLGLARSPARLWTGYTVHRIL